MGTPGRFCKVCGRKLRRTLGAIGPKCLGKKCLFIHTKRYQAFDEDKLSGQSNDAKTSTNSSK